jgi:hypothetical protein
LGYQNYQMIFLLLVGVDTGGLAGLYVLFFVVTFFMTRNRLRKKPANNTAARTNVIAFITAFFLAPILVIILASAVLGIGWYLS